ncbi:MAG: hypothetical protein EZS28_041747 [Streblomastix strix]|uniref:Uncharacterized protein n=1 Tax=Streblomastix strix TaxID=222440 RepID=A0A5J4TWU9_9EUKA|nr:MAG: hypothetical protein EZS28_041747 [Streblomastix strix]
MQVIHSENKSKIHLNDVHLNDGIKCYDLHDVYDYYDVYDYQDAQDDAFLFDYQDIYDDDEVYYTHHALQFALVSIASSTPRCQWNYSVSRLIKEVLADIFETDDYCDVDPEYDSGIIAIIEFFIYYSTISFFFKLKPSLFISAAFDSQVSFRTFTGLMTHIFSVIFPTILYPSNADIVIIIIMDTQNIILANIFNPTLFIELRAFRGVIIRMKIPPYAATHEHTTPN